jgi:cytochrome c-type biogenesis protein CcmH
MNRKTIVILMILMLGMLAGFLSPAAAQDTQPTSQAAIPTPSDNDVNAVAKQMFCPVCENIPLDVCPTTACQEWRELIRQKLAEGWTDQQIKEYFVVQYGDRVLSEPPRRGFNWLVYILPPVFFVMGAMILWNVFRSMHRPASGEKNTPGAQLNLEANDGDDPYLAQLEDELRQKPE